MITIQHDSISFTTTTPQEAVDLAALLQQSHAVPTAAPNTDQPIATKRPYHRRAAAPGVNPVFRTLYESPMSRMSRSMIASALKIKKRAVPAMVAHAHRWAKQAAPGQPFAALIVKEGEGDSTLFSLTDAGRALIQNIATTH